MTDTSPLQTAAALGVPGGTRPPLDLPAPRPAADAATPVR